MSHNVVDAAHSQSSSGTPATPSTHASSRGVTQLKSVLQGRDFAAQSALLTPAGANVQARPVQRKAAPVQRAPHSSQEVNETEKARVDERAASRVSLDPA